jgi:hypothetical protein
MRDPVSTVDGHAYERVAIARWLAQKRTSPLTGAWLPSTQLIPNHSLRKLIGEYVSCTRTLAHGRSPQNGT